MHVAEHPLFAVHILKEGRPSVHLALYHVHEPAEGTMIVAFRVGVGELTEAVRDAVQSFSFIDRIYLTGVIWMLDVDKDLLPFAGVEEDVF